MKTKRIIAGVIIALSVVACGTNGNSQVSNEAKALLPSKAQVDSVSYLLGINFGSMIKGYNFGDLNYSQVINGIEAFINAKGNPRDEDFGKQFKIDPNEMNDIINNYLGKRHEYTLKVNLDKERAFLAKNKEAADVVETESGLQYIILEPGNDNHAGPADTVYVNYKGTLLDGTVFDQTPEGSEPMKMMLNRVIKGWTEGLQLVGEGGKIRLFVPAALGYGEQGSGQIEPNATLIFDVDVAKVGHKPEEEEQ